MFCTRTYNRLLRPGLADHCPRKLSDNSELRRAFDQFDEKIDRWINKRESARVKLELKCYDF